VKRPESIHIDLPMSFGKSSLWCLLFAALVVCSVKGASEKPTDVSVRQLVSNPKKFDGKKVSVHGYFDGTDMATLRASANAPREIQDIFLDLRSELARKLTARRFLKGYVDVSGTFQCYKPTPLDPKPIPGNPKYVIVSGNPGFGYAGFKYQITNITHFGPVAPTTRNK
jgi:hypothetical protein